MISTICYIMAREKMFDDLPIVNEKFLPFIKRISSGYNNVSYHNKTHATDLS